MVGQESGVTPNVFGVVGSWGYLHILEKMMKSMPKVGTSAMQLASSQFYNCSTDAKSAV
jgi:hypothetical protein